MKRILTLVLCWLLVFEAFAGTTFKAKTAASVAGGYVTSLNKVDGSFEDGTTGWVASVGTITATASTEFQGNFKGVWAGTGTGTLDLQWTATASNTFEVSAQVNVKGEDDVYVCAYVGITETGCKLIPALDKIQKVSVIADSVMGSAFYLRLKHTGSDAFSIDVDDGKIEPWTQNVVNLVQQESIVLTGYSARDVSSVKFKTLLTEKSKYGNILKFDQNSPSTYTRIDVLKDASLSGAVSIEAVTSATYDLDLIHYKSDGTIVEKIRTTTTYSKSVPFPAKASSGDYFIVSVVAGVTITDSTMTNLSITATAISENVLMSYQDGMATTATYTMNIGSTGTPPTKGTVLVDKATWYRDGADAVITYTFAKGAADGAAGTGLYKFPLPSGLRIDTAKISLASDMTESAVSKLGTVVGFGSHGTTMTANATKNYRDLVYAVDATNLALMFGLYVAGPDEGFIPLGATLSGTVFTSLHGHVSFTAKVPILGWSSTPTLLALPTSKDNNKTYDQSLVSVIGTNWTTSTAKFYPYRTISKVTGAPVWRMAFNITGTNSTGQNNTLTISGVSFPASNQTVSSYAHAGTTAVAVAVASTSTLYGFWSTSGSQVVDFSGDVELASKPTWADEWVEPGVFVGNVAKNQVAYVKDVKASGTNGGTSVAATWTKRTLNTVEGDTAIVSLASDQITLQAGEYDIEATSPFYKSVLTKIRLRNITDGATSIVGASSYANDTYFGEKDAQLKGRLSLSASKVFEIQYYITGALANTGLGNANTFGENEVYTQVKITKLNGN